MDRPEIPDTWAAAADLADFPFYELEYPRPDARWAGGYGWRHQRGRPDGLEILFLVGEQEISVYTFDETARPRFNVRHLLMELVDGWIVSEDTDLHLPMTWTAESLDRDVAVEGTDVRFTGIALNEIWAGWAMLSSGLELKIRAPLDVVPTVLQRCLEWFMDETRPETGSR